MKARKLTTEYRVAQAVGSMAIEGIRVSEHSREQMKRVIDGEVTGAELRRELVNRYRRQAASH